MKYIVTDGEPLFNDEGSMGGTQDIIKFKEKSLNPGTENNLINKI